MELRLHLWAASLAIAVFGSACGEAAIGDLDDAGGPRVAEADSSDPTDGVPTLDEPSGAPVGIGGQCWPVELEPLPGCDGLAYYVDAAQGSDANPGSNDAPWRSLKHARSSAPSAATICVKTGNYGSFSESAPPNISERHVIRAAPGETPTLSGIDVVYSSPRDAHLTLSGFDVRGSGGGYIVVADNTIGIRFSGLHVSGVKWAVGGVGVNGMSIIDSQDAIVDGTKFDSIHRGIQVQGSDNTKILNNYIVATAGTGIQYLNGNTAGEISYNHITGADWSSSDPDAVQDPHSSIISFRSDDVVIRGNHMHGMGSSSGIMFYQPDVAGGEASYDDILIENNAIYDVVNVYAIRFYNLGTNVELRNNVVFPGIRTTDTCGIYNTTNDARYRYNTAIVAHNLAGGSTGLKLYNNILVGSVNAATENERNNFVWSWANWRAVSPSGTSEIITSEFLGCGNHDPIFEDGSFFNVPINPTFPGRGVYDLSLAPTSAGVNFGDPAFQATPSIGSVDANGFVQPDGPCRGPDALSVGAHEFGG